MVDIDPKAHMSIDEHVGLKRFIASPLDGPVDVIDREWLRPQRHLGPLLVIVEQELGDLGEMP
jgi:hypothetical protein